MDQNGGSRLGSFLRYRLKKCTARGYIIFFCEENIKTESESYYDSEIRVESTVEFQLALPAALGSMC